MCVQIPVPTLQESNAWSFSPSGIDSTDNVNFTARSNACWTGIPLEGVLGDPRCIAYKNWMSMNFVGTKGWILEFNKVTALKTAPAVYSSFFPTHSSSWGRFHFLSMLWQQELGHPRASWGAGRPAPNTWIFIGQISVQGRFLSIFFQSFMLCWHKSC